jgi:hypothetical protein
MKKGSRRNDGAFSPPPPPAPGLIHDIARQSENARREARIAESSCGSLASRLDAYS